MKFAQLYQSETPLVNAINSRSKRHYNDKRYAAMKHDQINKEKPRVNIFCVIININYQNLENM